MSEKANDKPTLASRREFLASGAAAAAGSAAAAKAADEPAGAFRIDVQSHMYPRPVLDYMMTRDDLPRAYKKDGNFYTITGEWHRRVREGHMDVDTKLKSMDEAGIQMTALSINDPGPERFGADGPKVAKLAHDFIGDIIKAHPSRFFGLATLPLQDEAASRKELDRCVDKLGFRGILLYSNLATKFPDEPQFRWLFKRAEEMDIPVLLHPAYPMTYDAVSGYYMVAGLGLMFDTTIALARIILAGILDEAPKLKLLCPHVGGTLPYLIGRIDHQTQVLGRGAEHIKKPPSEYLRQIYLDTVTPIALGIQYGLNFIGEDRLLYASDHPWVDPKLIIKNVESLKLGDATKSKIYHDNARRLFQL